MRKNFKRKKNLYICCLHLFATMLLFSNLLIAAEYSDEGDVNPRFDEHKDELKDSALITEYPELKKYLYIPPKSPIYIGLGFAPISLMGSKLYFSMNLFQVHYLTENWDLELFSASIGLAKSNKSWANSQNFTARTSPKWVFLHIFDTGLVSVGPLIGMEYAEFKEIQVKKSRNNKTTKDYENLTVGGYILGAELSQTFSLPKDRKFKVSEIFYRQHYNVESSEHGWNYLPREDQREIFDVEDNKKNIAATNVFLLEFSYLF